MSPRLRLIFGWISCLLSALLGAGLTFFWMHDPKTPAADFQKARALIERTTHEQVTILRHFPSLGDIEGFVVSTKPPSDKQGIVYVDNQGRFLVSGSLVDEQGQNLAKSDFEMYIQPTLGMKKPAISK